MTAPAYYLGHPARLWITVMRPRRRGTTSRYAMPTVTGGGKQTPGAAALLPVAERKPPA
jgi:hypothetical protein